jgi:hypothetical protein
MASAKTGVKRLQKELIELNKNPVPYITATPLDSNIFKWHFVVQPGDDTVGCVATLRFQSLSPLSSSFVFVSPCRRRRRHHLCRSLSLSSFAVVFVVLFRRRCRHYVCRCRAKNTTSVCVVSFRLAAR